MCHRCCIQYLLSLVFVALISQLQAQTPIIIDHEDTDIFSIPESEIVHAKETLHIAYGHTSHGSQVTSGMTGMVAFMNGLGYTNNLYAWNNGVTGGALDLHDTPFSGASDLGNPNRTAWALATRNYLDTHTDVNVIIWSWCGQASTATASDIISYLGLMSQLEIDYPNVLFVYMTGHLDGTGAGGNLNVRNQQIRDYCTANGKILYDFADIESFDPDGLVNYMALNCNDYCAYDSNGDGTRDSNWALDWQSSHTENVDWYSCSAAHSLSLNGNRKAYAAWSLWVALANRITGVVVESPSSLTAVPDSAGGEVVLSWTDNSSNEDSFIVRRRVNGGSWDEAYASTAADTVTFTDTGMTPGVYEYRIVAHLDDDGEGNPADSFPSNTASATIVSTDPPVAPSLCSATADSAAAEIIVTWTDNSDNENGFTVQRCVNGGVWSDSYAQVSTDTTEFVDGSLPVGVYAYRIVAFSNEYGSSSVSNESSAEIVDLPSAPSDLSASASAGVVILNWTDNSLIETQFVVQRRVESGAWDLLYALLPENSESYTDDNKGNPPLPTGSYMYRVMAGNGDGDSPVSNEAGAVISSGVPSAPTNLSSAVSGYSVFLSWDDNSGDEESFVIERKADSDAFIEFQTVSANITDWTDSSVLPYHTYSYRVKAVNSVGTSNLSNEVSEYIYYQMQTVRLEGTTLTDDSFIFASSPDANYGTERYVSDIDRFLLKFDLSSLQGKYIISAEVAFYVWSQSNWQPEQYLDVYRVTRDWSEASVSWNVASSGVSWTTAGGDFAEKIGSIAHVEGSWDHVFYPPLDVTASVTDWTACTCENYGFLVVNDSVTGIGFKASEYNSGQCPYLEVTYSDLPPWTADIFAIFPEPEPADELSVTSAPN